VKLNKVVIFSGSNDLISGSLMISGLFFHVFHKENLKLACFTFTSGGRLYSPAYPRGRSGLPGYPHVVTTRLAEQSTTYTNV
jgi:hypothetical protein